MSDRRAAPRRMLLAGFGILLIGASTPLTGAAPPVLGAPTGTPAPTGSAEPDGPAVSAGPGGPTVREGFTEGLAGRPVAIAGFENHSVNVAGDDQVAVYDDSNLFIDRDGPINANTGDTDSSGLNAVDVTGSRVRSGNSDARANPDSESDDEAEDNGGGSTNNGSTNGRAPTGGSSSSGPRTRGTASVVDPDVTTSASGRNPLVVGADGFDDLAVRTAGNRNLVVYDDSNVVRGGSGKVNAEIGDSDTGGAVVMGITDSDVAAGTNFE